MKKLLCIVCLLAAVLFVDAANASVGSPMRNGLGYTTSVSVSRHVNRIGKMAYRPTHYRFHGHRFGLRHGFRTHRLGYRHGLRRYGHRRVAFAR